jgi:membrane protease YdiL (CAAX protease family)
MSLRVRRSIWITLHTTHLVEFAIFLLQIVPSMVLSLAVTSSEPTSFGLLATSVLVRDLSLIALIGFFLWRNGEPAARVGLSTRTFGREVLLGVVLFLPVHYATGLLNAFLESIGFSGPSGDAMRTLTAAKSSGDLILGVLLALGVAITEEVVFRGYFLLRFRELTSRNSLAALASAVFFSIGHGYEGSAGVVAVGVFGLMLAAIYLWRGTLVAAIVIHFLQDAVGIVLLPALQAQ